MIASGGNVGASNADMDGWFALVASTRVPSCRSTSDMVAGRSAARFASIVVIVASSEIGRFGHNDLATGGGDIWCIAISSPTSPSNGGCPQTISNRMHPRA